MTPAYDPGRHAELVAGYCLDARPGERVLVSSPAEGWPLAAALHAALRARGAEAPVRLVAPDGTPVLVRPGAGGAPEPLPEAVLADLDAVAHILAPAPVPAVPLPAPARPAASSGSGRRPRRWTITLFPTRHAAAGVGLSLPDYEAFVARAMFLDAPDPAARWTGVREAQARLIDRLSTADEVRLVGPDTDLRLSVKGRVWANSDGKRNMPSGEVFTGPLETSAEGRVFFALPTLFRGREVAGVRLAFRAGEVVAASAEVGEDVLRAALATDPGARFLGELGIGTNFGITRPTRHVLFDEKIGGTVHLALGSSYPETGGTNASALHWDLVCDLRAAGELLVDGAPLLREGRFVGVAGAAY